jgi:hypothetical protein
MRALLPIAFAIALAGMNAASGGEVSVHGSSTVMNAMMAPRQAEIEKRPGQQLRIVGTDHSVASLTFSMVARRSQ